MMTLAAETQRAQRKPKHFMEKLCVLCVSAAHFDLN
jgi:hypothetical protein